MVMIVVLSVVVVVVALVEKARASWLRGYELALI